MPKQMPAPCGYCGMRHGPMCPRMRVMMQERKSGGQKRTRKRVRSMQRRGLISDKAAARVSE